MFVLCCLGLVSHAQGISDDAVYQSLRDRLNECDFHDVIKSSSIHHELFAYDSLQKNYSLLASHMADYSKINIAVRPDYDTAWHYLNLSEQIALDYRQSRALAKAQIFKAYYHSVQYERASSLEYINRARETFSVLEPQADSILDKGMLYMMMADIYKVFNMFDSAMSNYQIVLAAAEASQRAPLKQKAMLR
ncbi:MAG: hypothetical protein AAFO69_07070, partial [Bacteroidota bacterium]